MSTTSESSFSQSGRQVSCVIACMIVVCALLGFDGIAQVTNPQLNYRIDLRQLTSVPTTSVTSNILLQAAVDANGLPTYNRPPNSGSVCYSWAAGTLPPAVNQTLPIYTGAGIANTQKLDLSAFYFFDVSSASCVFNAASFPNPGDIIQEEKAFLIDPAQAVRTNQGFSERNLPFDKTGTLVVREFMRPAAGTSLSNPLDLGTIPTFETRSHINSNFAPPTSPNVSSPGLYGYSSTYGPANHPEFTDAPDVTYKFKFTEPGRIRISTQFPETNFDTKIHLVLLGPGGTFTYLAGNDNANGLTSSSIYDITICSGDYGIIVEGNTAGAIGNFQLQVNKSISWFTWAVTGSVSSPSLLPSPREGGDAYASYTPPPSWPPIRTTLLWQQNENLASPNWVNAPGKNDSSAYLIPDQPFSGQSKTVQYRAINTACSDANSITPVTVKTVIPNGSISGRVTSRNGTGVSGITINVKKRNTSLPGSPQSFVYTRETTTDGTFVFPVIYYGDPTVSSSTEFSIWASKQGHGFNFDTLYRTLFTNVPAASNVNFVDTTVFSITGRTFQQCNDCNDANGAVQAQTCPLDSVEIFRDNSFFTKTGFLNPPGEYGQFALSVTDPGTYKIEPRYRSQTFTPAFINQSVTGNVGNVNFQNTTTRTISGTFSAGCGDYIGQAVLEFTDVPANDAQGNPRSSCFRKRVTTNSGSGTYTITLPARRYRVKVVDVINGTENKPDVLAFFNTLSPDSLTRNITDANATLNLVYNRPPTIQISGFQPVCTPPAAFAVLPQNTTRDITVSVYQGPASKNCPARDTTITLITNIQVEDVNETLSKKSSNGQAVFTLKGGTPNIIAPYRKTLFATFRDVYGRSAADTGNVVVTGLKSNIGSFLTVSPEVPLMVLHDPPGDNSFSFWETSQANETAVRMYAAEANNTNTWGEVKVGTAFQAGLGLSTETSIWGSIKGSVGVEGRNTTSGETILTTKTTTNFSTAGNDAVVGAQGDVFIGAAINLKYAVTNEVTFNPATCAFALNKKMIVAPDGFATQYIYTEGHIRNTLIPLLRQARDNPANTAQQRQNFANQVNVWEQALENNDKNKAQAAFDKNISFDGSAGPITSTTTTTTTRSTSVEFDMAIASEVAAELGLEIAGSGASGGSLVSFRMETGRSSTSTVVNETTFGYTLDDDDNGDFFSINIKKDPVYKSPVFELVAATASCPAEDGAQPRDEMQLVIPEPVKQNIAPDGEAQFILKIGNTSQSEETRTYRLSFVQASNPNGAIVTIGGSPAIVPVDYTISYLGEVQVIVTVKRSNASNIFSYEGLQFMVTDACDGSVVKTGSISAFFQSTCSGIVLQSPGSNWVNTAFENNLLPILLKGYSLAGLSNVSLEYARVGTNSWTTAFTLLPNQLANSVNGTEINWNISSLSDGAYILRAKLVCPSGIVYSDRSSGIIDRTAPQPIGRQEPTDDVFIRGDAIAANYNEALNCALIDSSKVTITRLASGQVIPGRIGCYQNRLVITPQSDISALIGDSFRIALKDIPDVYGNTRRIADIWEFVVRTATTAAGPLALTVSGTNMTVLENSGDTMRYRFILPAAAPNDIRVNFGASGSAVFGKDYNVFFENGQPISKEFDGSRGTLYIRQGASNVQLKVVPVGNTFFEPDKTLTLNLLDGGDYLLGANLSITGSIVNDDVKSTYVFTGNGNFSNPANWQNNTLPPGTLPTGDEIIINPASGECILNVPVTIMKGAKITVAPGKIIRLNTNLTLRPN